ncbi:transposase [Brevifollis gellanilyticus]|uniref:Transposase IS200-like domain-containing protein n=1 Tax=Brevifollis gellanilyticus TaxID=748831 RepID=A0A512M4Z9_9BACT|nr:transposase [Brevifollis gellanilyticus]GEP41807.1 hypothetical protein BGE01nite_10980 [Brevifollis gellanilyticus]
MNFIPFNPAERVEISHGLLPHWQQTGRTYFITWRTADSIPVKLWKQWQAERDDWLFTHKASLAELRTLSAELQREYHNRFSRRWQDHLDECHGECLLRQSAIRSTIESALRHFDGQRYDLGDFVLMPNHVHVLVTLHADIDVEKTCFSWKRFSGGKINELLGRSGEFWQPESFDHIIRTAVSLRRIQQYIEENPAKARLCPGEFTWHRPDSWH